MTRTRHRIALPCAARVPVALAAGLMAWAAAGCSPGAPPPGSATISHQLDVSITIPTSPERGDRLTATLQAAPAKHKLGSAWLRWHVGANSVGMLYFRDDGQPRQLLLGNLGGSGLFRFNFLEFRHDYAFILHLVGHPHRPVAVAYIKAQN